MAVITTATKPSTARHTLGRRVCCAPGLTFDVRRADQTRTAALLRDGTVMAAVTASAHPRCGNSAAHPPTSGRFARELAGAR